MMIRPLGARLCAPQEDVPEAVAGADAAARRERAGSISLSLLDAGCRHPRANRPFIKSACCALTDECRAAEAAAEARYHHQRRRPDGRSELSPTQGAASFARPPTVVGIGGADDDRAARRHLAALARVK